MNRLEAIQWAVASLLVALGVWGLVRPLDRADERGAAAWDGTPIAFDTERWSDVVYPSAYGPDYGTEACASDLLTTVQEAGHAAYNVATERVQPLTSIEEEGLGDAIHDEVRTDQSHPFYGRVDLPADDDLRRYLQSLVDELEALTIRTTIPYQVHTVNLSEPNAMASLGGHVYVFTGLFTTEGWVSSEATLVAVLAHEMAHVDLRHTSALVEAVRALPISGISGEPIEVLMAQQLLQLPISQQLELEADRYAIERTIALQYSPYAYAELWARVGDETLHNPDSVETNVVDLVLEGVVRVVDTHPPAEERACRLRALIREMLDGSRDQPYYVGTANLESLTPRSEHAL